VENERKRNGREDGRKHGNLTYTYVYMERGEMKSFH